MDDKKFFGRLPTSPKMSNNQNNQNYEIDEDFTCFGIPGLENEVDPEMMDFCSNMDLEAGIIASEDGNEALTEQRPELNNQMDVELMEMMEYNPDKPKYELNVYDPTLTVINGGLQEEEYPFESNEDTKSYADISNCSYPQQHQQQQQMGGAYINQYQDQYQEFQIDQKVDLTYLQNQEPTQIYRVEVQQQQQYVPPSIEYQIDQKMFHMSMDSKPSSGFLPSPTPSTLDEYFREDNNTNFSPPPFVPLCKSGRSRKTSIASSCGGKKITGKSIIGKVCQNEKPFRNRMTKTEMNKMTDAQKELRKKNQNKVNAKNCVARKNKGKKELAKSLPILETNLEIMKKFNGIQENGLLRAYENVIYPQYQINSQYGSIDQFKGELEYSMNHVEVEVDNNGIVIQLKDELTEAQAKFDEIVASNGDPNVKVNTYASRKSRAKTILELADLNFKTQNLEQEIHKCEKFGVILEQFTQKINLILAGLGATKMPETIVYIGLIKQFEPS